MTGIHPTIISESFQKALEKGIEILTDMSRPVELSDRETLLNSATTSLNSKVRQAPDSCQINVCYSVILDAIQYINSKFQEWLGNCYNLCNWIDLITQETSHKANKGVGIFNIYYIHIHFSI